MFCALAAAAPACGSIDDSIAGSETRTATVDFGSGPVDIDYVEDDGMAVVGDMILGPVEEVESGLFSLAPLYAPKPAPNGDVVFSAIKTRAWPNGRIPYHIAPGLGLNATLAFENAVATWNATGAVSFVPMLDTDDVFLTVFPAPSSMAQTEGHATVGYNARYPRRIRLGAQVFPSIVAHELGHVIGLLHEHTRPDRGSHVNINWPNIMDGKEGNFQKFTASDERIAYDAYDIDSIMGYASSVFAENPRVPTITRAGCPSWSTAPACLIVPSSTPTAGDIRAAFRANAGSASTFRNDYTQRCMRPNLDKISMQICDSDDRITRWFLFSRRGGGYNIVNEDVTKCMTARSPTSSQSTLQLKKCDGSMRQLFDVEENGSGVKLRLRGSQECARNTSASSYLYLSSCSSTSSRRWFLGGS